MKCLCVAGFGPSLHQIYSILTKAGMAPALSADGNPSVDIHFWQRQVLNLFESQPAHNRPLIAIDEMWERLASEIVLANSDTPLWGWGDELNIHFLDFWLRLDSRTNFVLLFISAESLVASRLDQISGDYEELEALLESWRTDSQILFKFGMANPERCLMFDVDEVLSDPSAMVRRLATTWRLPLHLPCEVDDQIEPLGGGLARLVARQLIQARPSLVKLRDKTSEEINPISKRPSSAIQVNTHGLIQDFKNLLHRDPKQCVRMDERRYKAIEDYHSLTHELRARAEQAEQEMQSLKTQLAITQTTCESRLDELQENLRAALAELARKDRLLEGLEDRLKTSVEENELILSYMHQAQEELANSIAQQEYLQVSREEIARLEAELAGALQRCEEKEEALRLCRQQFDQLRAESVQNEQHLVAIRSKLDSYVAENETLMQQLLHTQEALELSFIEREESETSSRENIKSLETRLAEVEYQRDVNIVALGSAQLELHRVQEDMSKASQLITTLEGRLQQTNNSMSVVQKQLQEVLDQNDALRKESLAKDREIHILENENEQLILQLHKVQEELELLFLRLKQTEQKLAIATKRLSRMTECYPDYVEFSSVEVISDSPECTRWQLNNVVLAGRDFEELRFAIVIEHGMAGFLFSGDDQASRHFLRYWPASRAEITLLPLGTPEQVQVRCDSLLALSDSEWRSLLALTDLMIAVLSSSQDIPAPVSFIPDQWLNGLRALKADLAHFPSVPRFDRILLKHQQVNPDYEHLWLAIDNLSIAGLRVDYFEFRLSCANVQPGMFGKFPKLEFPSCAAQGLFNSWFEESHDDFGPKLELRFAYPSAMDIGVWGRLSAEDRNVLRILIKNLPSWLRYLEMQEVPLSRPWSDWQNMATEIQRITKQVGSEKNLQRISAPEPHTNGGVSTCDVFTSNVVEESVRPSHTSPESSLVAGKPESVVHERGTRGGERRGAVGEIKSPQRAISRVALVGETPQKRKR